MNPRALHKYILELEGSLIRGSREQEEEAAPFFFCPRFSLSDLARLSLIALSLWECFYFFPLSFERLSGNWSQVNIKLEDAWMNQPVGQIGRAHV